VLTKFRPLIPHWSRRISGPAWLLPLAASSPLGRVAEAPQDEKTEQWLLGRQGQWLAEQEFLKQLWERSPAINPA
jgi:hypothetical protein